MGGLKYDKDDEPDKNDGMGWERKEPRNREKIVKEKRVKDDTIKSVGIEGDPNLDFMKPKQATKPDEKEEPPMSQFDVIIKLLVEIKDLLVKK